VKTVTVHSREGYQQEIMAGSHTFMSDLPISEGGNETAPEPYDLLLAALGACTSMTLRMYAERKGWNLEDIRVELSIHKSPGEKDVIHKKIEVTGDLTEDQIERLRYIATRCPVNLTLRRGVEMEEEIQLASTYQATTNIPRD